MKIRFASIRFAHALFPVHVFAIVAIALLAACQPVSRGDSTANDVIRSDSDHRSFRYVELPNRLRVLLISAPDTDKAAAALDVNVGSRQDPKERPGLAHFLEHMLFLGTDKYPQPDDYQDFISAHGGSHNAFTAFEHTNYFFDIDSAHLEPALDRFARFFVAPLFSADYVEREKHAVDSEFQANIQSDAHRQLDVMRETVNPEHPFAKFSVGNLATLADEPGHPVRDDLLAFYDRYYSANQMTLVVIGREPLDQLQRMVSERFAAVPNRNRTVEPITAPLYTPQQLPQFVQIQSVQEQRSLTLAWPLPDQRADYRNKSLDYIGNILGHEGRGSLLSALKQRGWALGLGAGQGLSYQGGAQFNIGIELTPAGSEHIDDIVTLVYQTLAAIRSDGVHDWLYREQKIVGEQRFRFREIPEPISEASDLAGNLHEYPVAEAIRGAYLMEQFEPRRIEALLTQLVPSRMMLIYSAPDAVVDRRSAYYATPYSAKAPGAAQLQAWSAAKPDGAVTMPEPNPFIARNDDVKTVIGERSKPQLLQEGGGLHLWHLQDRVFGLPKAAVTLEIRSPHANDSAADAAKTELLVRVLRENLNEFSYPAALAGLSYDISRNGRGVVVRIGGFDEKQPVLLDRILQSVRQPQFDAAVVQRVHDEYRRELRDNIKEPPYRLLLAELPNVLIRDRWSDDEMLAAVDGVDLAQLRRYAEQWLTQLDIEMLVYGNVLEADARQLGALVTQSLLRGAQAAAPDAVQVLKLPPQTLRRTLPAPHEDAALLWYRQAADNAKSSRAALGVSAQMLSADFYARLRTEQQLGYIVMSSVYPVRDVPGLVLLVQSPHAGPAALAKAYREFFERWSKRSDAELRPLFERHRAALAQRLAQEPKNFGEANDRLWQDLASGYRDFDSRDQILAAVNELTFEQWLALFRRDVLAQDGHTLWLSSNGRFRQNALQAGSAIDDLQQFKRRQTFYRFE